MSGFSHGFPYFFGQEDTILRYHQVISGPHGKSSPQGARLLGVDASTCEVARVFGGSHEEAWMLNPRSCF